jgi:Prophage antirepressor
MTAKQIAELCEVTERAVQLWTKKADENISEKISSAGHGKPADFTLDEALAIIRAGGKNTLADLLADNAQKSAAPAAVPAVRPSRYPFFDRSDCAAVLSELRQCCAANLLSRDSFNNIVLGTVPATVLRQVPRSSAIDQFIQSNLLFVSGSYEKAADVHARYLMCGGVADMTMCRLTRYLKTNYPDVAVKQKKLEGYPAQVYQNVRLTPTPVAIAAASAAVAALPAPQAGGTSTENRTSSALTFNGQPLRIVTKNGKTWFRAIDIFCVLELEEPYKKLGELGNDEKITFGKSGWHVSASGLDKLAGKSHKPEAEAFKAWITAEGFVA